MLRFTIRDVLWLMVVVAVAIGWWTTARRLQAVTNTVTTERQIYLEIERALNEEGRYTTAAGNGSVKLRSFDDPGTRIDPFAAKK